MPDDAVRPFPLTSVLSVFNEVRERCFRQGPCLLLDRRGPECGREKGENSRCPQPSRVVRVKMKMRSMKFYGHGTSSFRRGPSRGACKTYVSTKGYDSLQRSANAIVQSPRIPQRRSAAVSSVR